MMTAQSGKLVSRRCYHHDHKKKKKTFELNDNSERKKKQSTFAATVFVVVSQLLERVYSCLLVTRRLRFCCIFLVVLHNGRQNANDAERIKKPGGRREVCCLAWQTRVLGRSGPV